MYASDLRVALFSGNYNYIRDGANQALNKLVAYAARIGVEVRVYSPVTNTPAFEPAGSLIGVKSYPIPGRGEYRWAIGLTSQVVQNLREFKPQLFHLSSPDILGHRALSFARKNKIPTVASMHTRFETYLRYYRLGWMEPVFRKIVTRFYNRCEHIAAPNQVMADVLHSYGVTRPIGFWQRGVDTEIFSPSARDLEWRRKFGCGDSDIVIGFTGRLVLEKGLEIFAQSLDLLREMGHSPKILIVGDGPARAWLEARLTDAVFTGHIGGPELGRAVAAMDIFFFPSPTEAFSNVTLEAMACGTPALVAKISDVDNLIIDGVNGNRSLPQDAAGFATQLAAYCGDANLRRNHGAAALETSKKFDWDKINQAMVDIWLDVAANR